MSTPWTTSVKDINLSKSSRHSNPHVPVSAGFTPPSVISTLSCGPQALFTAMAKAQALRTANAAIVAALERGASALVEAIVDDAGAGFDLAPEADMLENTVRRALSGSVGAGVCHLYMVSLGYVWQDFAAEVISTSGKLADFAYDGGAASGHGIVLAEAKGSFSDKVDVVRVRKTADDAYKKQVHDHIAARTKNSSAQVVHGYALAFGAQPDAVRRTASAPHAMFHLAETDPRPVAASGTPPARGGAGAAGGAGAVDAALALGNYRAVFMLARAPLVVNAIDFVRTGRRPVEGPEDQRLSSVWAGGHEFWLGDPEGHPDGWRFRDLFPPGGGAFAIEATVADRFLNLLTGMIREARDAGPIASRRTPRLELPVVEPRLFADDEAVWFPDGLAWIGKIERREKLRWSPIKGLI